MSINVLLLAVVQSLVGNFASQYLGTLLRSVLDFIPHSTMVAVAGSVDVPASALNAPSELKDYTVQLLQKLVNGGGLPIYARIILNQVIKFLPEIEDSLWNMLFTKGIVPNSVPEVAKAVALCPVSDELLEYCTM